MKHVFIINPRAGKRDQTRRIYEMADALRARHGVECACMLTQRPGGAAELARRAAEEGPVRLYACGGAGTLSEVAGAVAGLEQAAVTVIPMGTGNDFLKNFGPGAPLFLDAENLWDGPEFPLDLMDCNGHLCLTIACTGIDARVARDVHRYRQPLLTGRGSYLCSVAVNFLFRPIGQRWRVWLGQEELEEDFALVAVCNGRYYGGGSMPAPRARMDDGALDAVVVKNVSKATFARLFGPYSAGRGGEYPHIVRTARVNEVRIRSCGEDLTTCLDGEIFQWPEAVVTLSEKRLRFFGPKGCDPNATAR